jgi:DNA-binding MarR family transcriptional regulator
MDPENMPRPGIPSVPDLTGDGGVTISDLSRWAVEAFFLPGDWAIWALARYAPAVARFLELDADSYGGVVSGVVSALGWLAVLLVLVVVWESIRRFDDAATQRVRLAYVEGRRRARIAWAGIRFRLRGGRPADPPPEIELAESLELTAAQLRILRAALDLEPPHALEVDALTGELGLRPREVSRLLEELASLNLLAAGAGRGRGSTAYTITSVGRAYLIFRQLAPRT